MKVLTQLLCIVLCLTMPLLHGKKYAKEDFIYDLFDCDVFKFGSFELKSGIVSPIYVDLRCLISFPKILNRLAIQLKHTINLDDVDCICGVPYTALPIATAFSLYTNKPMIMCRKEIKTYGTQNRIEGVYEKGMRVLVIEDCFTTGKSALEIAKYLEDEGLKVIRIAVVVDREQGGKEFVESKGYSVSFVYTLSEVLIELERRKLISHTDAQVCRSYILDCKAHKQMQESAHGEKNPII